MKIIGSIIKSINFVICFLLVLTYIGYIILISYCVINDAFNSHNIINNLKGLLFFLFFTSWIPFPSVIWLYLFLRKKSIIQNLIFNLVIFLINVFIPIVINYFFITQFSL